MFFFIEDGKIKPKVTNSNTITFASPDRLEPFKIYEIVQVLVDIDNNE